MDSLPSPERGRRSHVRHGFQLPCCRWSNRRPDNGSNVQRSRYLVAASHRQRWFTRNTLRREGDCAPARLRLPLEFELQIQAQHARVQDGRGHAARRPCQIRLDGRSERVALGQDRIRVEGVEKLSFPQQSESLANMENLPYSQVELTQTRCKTGTWRDQLDRLRLLRQTGVN